MHKMYNFSSILKNQTATCYLPIGESLDVEELPRIYPHSFLTAVMSTVSVFKGIQVNIRHTRAGLKYILMTVNNSEK